MTKTKGFTLIELMIVVAIIAIIMSIAIPSYYTYIERTRRSTAQADLMELAQWMERRYNSNNFDYSDSGSAPTLPFNTSPQNAGTTYYDLSLTAISSNSFTLTAVPKGAQASDSCGSLTVDDAGNTGAAKTDCW